MRRLFSMIGLVSFLVLGACVPKEEIQFKGVSNIVVEASASGEPMLKGDAMFFNPNSVRMKLRKANIEIMVNDKKSATVNQEYNLEIPANGDFTVPVEAQLSLKEVGVLNTIASILGGKKYKLQFMGTIHASVRGVRVRVPVNHVEETKLKF